MTENAAEGMAEVLLDGITDHPMWIDDHGDPLEYLPLRERLIGDYVHEAAEALAAAGYGDVREFEAELAPYREFFAPDIDALAATWQATLDQAIDEANRQLAEKDAKTADVLADLKALVESLVGVRGLSGFSSCCINVGACDCEANSVKSRIERLIAKHETDAR